MLNSRRLLLVVVLMQHIQNVLLQSEGQWYDVQRPLCCATQSHGEHSTGVLQEIVKDREEVHQVYRTLHYSEHFNAYVVR